MTAGLCERLTQILALVEREDYLLCGVRERLFQGPPLDTVRLMALLETPKGIDRLESFTSKFCRMQDTFVDKLLPVYLRSQGAGRVAARELPQAARPIAAPCRAMMNPDLL
jgi:hypothetical protein